MTDDDSGKQSTLSELGVGDLGTLFVAVLC